MVSFFTCTYHYIIYVSIVLCLVEAVSISFSKNFNQSKLTFCLANKLVSAIRHGTWLAVVNVIWVSHLALKARVYFFIYDHNFQKHLPIATAFLWMHNIKIRLTIFYLYSTCSVRVQWLGQWAHNQKFGNDLRTVPIFLLVSSYATGH